MTAPPRRFLRFSLRAILVAMLAIGVALGWALHKAREQGVAVAALQKLGYSVEYANEGPLTILERLRMWCGEKRYRDVAFASGFASSQVTDAALLHLERLTQLQFLYLNGTQITDAGLARLGGLTQLQGLELSGTQIADAGLAHLERLTQLGWLKLNETQLNYHRLKPVGSRKIVATD